MLRAKVFIWRVMVGALALEDALLKAHVFFVLWNWNIVTINFCHAQWQ